MDLISIIVPIYNVEVYLKKCIDSLINQTYSNIEIILVDDGSTDSSPIICDKYSIKDYRIKAIHKKNGGLSDARNKGIEIAAGKYIMFVDSDDFIMPTMVEKMHYEIQKNSSKLIMCNFEYVNQEGKPILCKENILLKSEVWSKDEFWIHYFSGQAAVCVVAWNKLYKREWFDKLRYNVGKYNEDEFIIKNIIDKSSGIKCIPEKLYCYTQRPDSIMGTFSLRRLDAAEAYIKRGNLFLNENKVAFAEQIITLAVELMIEGYLKLDLNKKDVKKRYTFLRKKLKHIYLKMQKNKLSLHFRLNTAVFLINERVYLFLHKVFGKKIY